MTNQHNYRVVMHCPVSGDFEYRYGCAPSILMGEVKWGLDYSHDSCVKTGNHSADVEHTLVKVELLPAFDCQQQRREIDELIQRLETRHVAALKRTIKGLGDNTTVIRSLERAVAEIEKCIVRLEVQRDDIITEPQTLDIVPL